MPRSCLRSVDSVVSPRGHAPNFKQVEGVNKKFKKYDICCHICYHQSIRRVFFKLKMQCTNTFSAAALPRPCWESSRRSARWSTPPDRLIGFPLLRRLRRLTCFPPIEKPFSRRWLSTMTAAELIGLGPLA